MSFKLAYDAALKHALSLSESGKVLQAGRRREDVLHFAHRAFGEQSLVRVLPASICVSVRTERVHPADASRACRVRRLPDETLLQSTKCDNALNFQCVNFQPLPAGEMPGAIRVGVE
jgi:hypothetical protein